MIIVMSPYIIGLTSLIYRAGLEMMCNVALERRMGFLSLDNSGVADNKVTEDMIKIMTALKGAQTASNQAMYGLPWWKYLPTSLSGVFTRLVHHKDTLFHTIGEIVDGNLEDFTTNSRHVAHVRFKVFRLGPNSLKIPVS